MLNSMFTIGYDSLQLTDIVFSYVMYGDSFLYQWHFILWGAFERTVGMIPTHSGWGFSDAHREPLQILNHTWVF